MPYAIKEEVGVSNWLMNSIVYMSCHFALICLPFKKIKTCCKFYLNTKLAMKIIISSTYLLENEQGCSEQRSVSIGFGPWHLGSGRVAYVREKSR